MEGGKWKGSAGCHVLTLDLFANGAGEMNIVPVVCKQLNAEIGAGENIMRLSFSSRLFLRLWRSGMEQMRGYVSVHVGISGAGVFAPKRANHRPRTACPPHQPP